MGMEKALRKKIQVLGRDNGAGLSRDLALVAGALARDGFDVTTTALGHREWLAQRLTAMKERFRAPRFDVNIMLQHIRPEFARTARQNVVIPNPEWFRRRDRRALQFMDEIWLKTEHAQPLFEPLGVPVRSIGFASGDRHEPGVAKKHAFFHSPGQSPNKGTELLLRVWAKHPEWPELVVVWRPRRANIAALPDNVTLIRDHIPGTAYRTLQNQYRFHLCPSETEGYGHYIGEAMSCEAVVVTLDAPPMNELVRANRGMLVAARAFGKQDLASLYAPDNDSLERVLQACINMDEKMAARLGAAAREWYVKNKMAFPAHLSAALRALLAD